MNEQKVTEIKLETSRFLEEMNSLEFVSLMNKEDEKVARAVQSVLPVIAQAIDSIVERWKKGGRVFVIGAGTSGRVAAVDAVELIPTFSIEWDRWVPIVAGGEDAFLKPMEQWEDDEKEVIRQLSDRMLGEKDVVIGVSASGSTPFVLSGLRYAQKCQSLTISISCNQGTKMSSLADIAIEVLVGPEVIRGSTRLKAGTAQKMVLNMLSTGVMVRIGKVYRNEMVEMQLMNEKLRKRAEMILCEVTGVSAEEATSLLQQSGFKLKTAIVMAMAQCSLEEAEKLLVLAEGKVRDALRNVR
jgi:N-acetylmuramic acid 6-phosphate etherase